MFVDNMNLFHGYKYITKRFATVNEELKNIKNWFMSNQLSARNTGKKNSSLFHKPSRVDDFGKILIIKK